jgi:hypothetical protein
MPTTATKPKTTAPLTAPALTPRSALTLADVLPDLVVPFPTNQVEVKPGATNKEKTRALALVYLKVQAIEQRLDDLVGPEHWSNQLVAWGDNGVIAALTILGITKYASGEGEVGDANCKTSAEAQAFKRAFTRFGCRYAYTGFPKNAWFDYAAERKSFANPYAVLIDLYRAAGLHDYVAEETEELARETARRLARRSERAADHDEARPIASSGAGRADVAHADRIRAAVRASGADAAHRGSPRLATGAARPISARQLDVLAERDQLANAHEQFGVERLEDLNFEQASALITALPPRRKATAAH